MHNKFRGTGVAVITPFLDNHEIDFKSFEKIIENLIRHGVNYIVTLGTTGESVVLSKEEKKEVIAFVIKQVNDRLPVVVGIGGNNTHEIVEFIKQLSSKGIDAILSVCPYYNKPQQRGIVEHYRAIAGVCPVPVIIYNVPGRTGTNIEAETTLTIAKEIPNIIAIKEASGDLLQCMQIIENKPKDFMVISGDDVLILPIIAMGGEGVISVTANVFPSQFSTMVNYALQGDFEKAREIHYQLFEIIQAVFADGNPSGIKAALNILGFCKNNLRLPLVPVEDAVFKQLEKLIFALKLITVNE